MIVSVFTVFLIEHIWRFAGGDKLKREVEERMKESEYLNMG